MNLGNDARVFDQVAIRPENTKLCLDARLGNHREPIKLAADLPNVGDVSQPTKDCRSSVGFFHGSSARQHIVLGRDN